ncbi:hypothetical protein MED222_06115 [Vibrio sp. MED222]|nr:hypothetical protein MED222_06115 [Vibrio sp. MED222]
MEIDSPKRACVSIKMSASFPP